MLNMFSLCLAGFVILNWSSNENIRLGSALLYLIKNTNSLKVEPNGGKWSSSRHPDLDHFETRKMIL